MKSSSRPGVVGAHDVSGFAARVRVSPSTLTPAVCMARITLQPLLELFQVYLKVAVQAGHSLAAVHVDSGHAFSKEATRSANDRRLDCCDGGAAGDIFASCTNECGTGKQLLAQKVDIGFSFQCKTLFKALPRPASRWEAPAGGLRHDPERLRLEHRAHLHTDAGETLLLRLPVPAGHGLQLGDVRQRG